MNRIFAHRMAASDKVRSNHDQVVRALGIGIIRGDHAVGSILPAEAELMARFDISRTVLREGLKTLAAKGLVQAKTKVGTRVRERTAWAMFDPDVVAWHLEAGIDARFLSDLGEIRAAVEPTAAALAAERRTDADIAAMRAAVEQMGAEGVGPAAFADADLAFHLAVANASGNAFMRSIGGVIEAALAAAFRISSPVDDAERHRASVAAHGAIVDAIEARDGEAARERMLAVIDTGLARIAKAMNGLSAGSS